MLCLFTVLNSNKSYFRSSFVRLFVCLTRVVIRVTGRVNEAIHIRLHPNNINRDCGIEVPEAWMPAIKQHNNKRVVRQRTAEGTNHWGKQQGSKWTNQSCWKTTYHSRASCLIRSRMTSRPHRLKKTSSMQPKRRDLHHTWLHRETNEKNLAFIVKSCFLSSCFDRPSKPELFVPQLDFPFF